MPDATQSLPAVQWSVVLPVKRRTAAKTRLGASLNLTQHDAGELAIAFALDTLASVSACPSVSRVIIVTDDDEAANIARAEYGADIVAELHPPEPAPGFARLNAAFRLGASHCPAGTALAALTADLPALDPGALSSALVLATAHERAFVPDRQGYGTVLLSAKTPELLDPRFGSDSAEQHRRSGAIELDGNFSSLRLDVDTSTDLAAAAQQGLGIHTRRLLVASPCAG